MKKHLFTIAAVLAIPLISFSQTLADKFIPTYFVKYGNKSVKQDPAYTAQFDLAVVSYGFHDMWSENGLNSWFSLKAYNPDMIIAVYQLGPSEYGTASWSILGDGWEWIKTNHGANAGTQRWTGIGHKYNYLANSRYNHERIMNLGHPEWQKYWIEKTYEARYTGKNFVNYKGADAIFVDNANYRVIWPNLWYEENNVGNPDFKDHPKDYASADGIYDHGSWAADMQVFFNLASSSLALKHHPVKIVPNFGYMAIHPESWHDLDKMENHPFAAMEEGAFSQPWGKTYNIFDWEVKVNAMRDLKNMAALMNNIGRVTEGQGLGKMDILMSEGNYGHSTGWDVLWYSMNSFLLALNETKTNGYFGFDIWSYGQNYYWFDEYDPSYLHLGRPLEEYYIPAEGSAKDVAFREYEDGWVVVNRAHTPSKTNVSVPYGRAWVVTHENLKDPYSDPLVTRFNIGKNRGLILLKEGKKINNEDN